MSGKVRWMKLLAPFFTGGILLAIYLHIDLRLLAERLSHLRWGFFALALFLFIPQITITSLRWLVMVKRVRPIDLWESTRLVMAGKALNALVPSKLGEMSKAYFLKMDGSVSASSSASLVILEKLLDMGGLCLILLLGAVLSPRWRETEIVGVVLALGVLGALAALLAVPIHRLAGKMGSLGSGAEKLINGWEEVVSGWKGRGGGLPAVLGLSALLWALHVFQIFLFFPTLGQPVPAVAAMRLIPLAIFVGLLPITVGGMGTRDSAIILLFSPYADAAILAGVGLLCSMRYWVDTLLGVPFFHRYTARIGSPPEPEGHDRKAREL